MDLSQRKEQFSEAYVHAVATVAGYRLSPPNVDDDSVDWTIAARGGGGTLRSPKLDIQLKCTGDDDRPDDVMPFRLSRKNYDDLRWPDYQVPRMLVVVVVPTDISQWLNHTEDELALRRCGYWTSIRGRAPTPNTSTVTIDLPRTQQFTVAELTGIMGRVGSGGLP